MKRWVNVKFRQKVFRIKGLTNANAILTKATRGWLDGVSKRLKSSAVRYMRRNTGESQRSLMVSRTGTFENARVDVFSNIVQAIVDAYGLRRGVFPPYAPGSRLHAWARKKLSGRASATVTRVAGPVSPDPLRRAGGRVISVRKVRPVARAGARVKLPPKDRYIEIFAKRVARKIYLQGIKPTHWNERALDANRNHILNDLRNAIRRAANEMTRG